MIKSITIFSMVFVLLLGILFIYQGVEFIRMKRKNPQIPDLIYLAASISIVSGALEVILAVAHFWFL